MSDLPKDTISLPGKSLSFRAGSMPPPDAKVNFTVATSITDFEQVKHLLSDKPLRTPRKILLDDR